MMQPHHSLGVSMADGGGSNVCYPLYMCRYYIRVCCKVYIVYGVAKIDET